MLVYLVINKHKNNMSEAATLNLDTISNFEVRPNLMERSGVNIGAITGSYIDQAVSLGQFENSEEAQDVLRRTESLVAQDNRLTVNMSADSLNRFLTVGQMETAWDYARQLDTPLAIGTIATLNSKNMGGGYTDTRSVAEEGLRHYAPDGATRHEPVYAALAGPREHMTGAAPGYGNYWLELDSSLSNRAVYVFSDSHASVRNNEGGKMEFDDSVVLNAHDAIAAKAVVDLVEEYHRSLGLSYMGNMAVNADPEKLMAVAGRRPGYIEAAFFDPITAENVTIGMALKGSRDLAGAGELFRQHPELMSKARAYCSENVSDVVVDWLSGRLPTELTTTDKNRRGTSQLWEQIGLSPDASIEEVDEALRRQASLTYRDATRFDNTLPRLAVYRDAMQWDRYIKSLRAAERNVTGEVQQTLAKLIDIQEARVFFAGKQELAAA